MPKMLFCGFSLPFRNNITQVAYLAGVGHAVEVGQWPEEVLEYDGRGRVEGGGNRAGKRKKSSVLLHVFDGLNNNTWSPSSHHSESGT